MTVYTAKTAGFCAGVARAINTVRREMQHKKLVTYGPLINNRIVTDELCEAGVRIIHDLDELQGGETVVLRAHGVPASVTDKLRERGIPYLDCTCRDVQKIHRIAGEAAADGRTLLILGDPNHPEVIGYAGDASVVLSGADDAKLAGLDPNGHYTLVGQTTYSRARFDEAIPVLRQYFTDLVVQDTICDATSRRQEEAAGMASFCDVMVVLGDKNSANTKHLYEICLSRCPRTVLAASVHEIQLQSLHTNDKIGITAGASTPPAITKEAIHFMSELTNTINISPTEIPAETAQPTQPQSFEEMLNESFIALHTGDVVKSTVISVSNSEVTVNLGYKSDGIITKAEMTEDPTADITQMVKPGDELEVYVLRVNDGDGNVQVSKKRLDAQTNYKMLEQAFNEKTPVEGKITEIVKGGLIAMINGCRVFVPSSQISNRYVEDLTVFKGKEFNFMILEYDRTKRRIVAGRKELASIEQQKRREELYAMLEIGQRIDGTVSRIVDFGAFIDLGGVDGLVHISELAWRRVRKVTDVLQVGDRVTATVIDVNPEKNKISLSLKDVNDNPWNNVADKYPIGSIVEGKVVRMAPFGAFVMLQDGVDGLVHISQIANRHIAKPDEELSIGQIINVKVTDIDEENHKISLSKREADALQGAADDDYYDDNDYDDDYADDGYADDDYADDEIESDVDDLAVTDEIEATPAEANGEDSAE